MAFVIRRSFEVVLNPSPFILTSPPSHDPIVLASAIDRSSILQFDYSYLFYHPKVLHDSSKSDRPNSDHDPAGRIILCSR